jgi:para-aminobenzoate synthetase component I
MPACQEVAMIPSITPLPYLSPAIVASLLTQNGMTRIAWLDSSNATEHKAGKFSILCANPIESSVTICASRSKISACINTMANKIPKHKGDLPFYGGVIGALSYPNPRGDIQLIASLYSWAFIFDHSDYSTHLVHWPEFSLITAEELIGVYTSSIFNDSHPRAATFKFNPLWNKDDYTQAFNQIKQYIVDGDTYQINLTQCFNAQIDKKFRPLDNFINISRLAQAPFSAFFEHETITLISASPERFVQIYNGELLTQPIKGTRKRGKSPEEDERIVQELRESAKDQAENLMIVDLLRNDLSISSKIGSVRTEQLFAIESFGTIHHLVSTVRSSLNDNSNAIDALLSAFPGGSITGAPKKRAMEIINELEAKHRGFYCGSIFYCSGEKLDSNILIRTFEINNDTGEINIWAGGGIVSDSEIDAEYQESLDKISRLIEIITG